MHEYSIVQALLTQVEAQANAHGAHAVHRLRVRIGEMSGIEVPLLESAYELFRERSICARAELEIVPVAVAWGCPRCDARLEPGAPLHCADCDVPARLLSGDEIVLERIEMEVA